MTVQAEFTRAAAYVLCRDDDGRVLLTGIDEPAIPHHGQWTLPGVARFRPTTLSSHTIPT